MGNEGCHFASARARKNTAFGFLAGIDTPPRRKSPTSGKKSLHPPHISAYTLAKETLVLTMAFPFSPQAWRSAALLVAVMSVNQLTVSAAELGHPPHHRAQGETEIREATLPLGARKPALRGNAQLRAEGEIGHPSSFRSKGVAAEIRDERLMQDEPAIFAANLYAEYVASGKADQEVWAAAQLGYTKESEPSDLFLFQAKEFHLQIFAAWEKGTDEKSGEGVGLGVIYYPYRHFGFGLEAVYIFDHLYDARFSALAHLRLPSDEGGFAFSIFGGIGLHVGSDSGWAGIFGAGLEFRLLERWSVFADGRRVESIGSEGYFGAHAGISILF